MERDSRKKGEHFVNRFRSGFNFSRGEHRRNIRRSFSTQYRRDEKGYALRVEPHLANIPGSNGREGVFYMSIVMTLLGGIGTHLARL